MRALRNVMLGAALLAVPAFAVAQDRDDRGRDRDRDRDRDHDRNNNNSRAYQQGQWDVQHNRRTGSWKNDHDRDDYERGYRGYRSGAYNNNGYRNGTYNNNGYYGNNGSYGNSNVYRNGNYGYNNGYGSNGNPAASIGFQDGMNDGQAARARGQGMTYGPGYNHPDRGYQNAYGDKNLYKQQYRQAYQQGFQQGYNGGARRGGIFR